MSALTKRKDRQTMFPRLGEIQPLAAKAGTYYHGSFIGMPVVGGLVTHANEGGNAAKKYAGICQEDIVIASDGEPIDVLVNCPFWEENNAIAVTANAGKPIFANDDGDITLATTNTPIGRIAAIRNGEAATGNLDAVPGTVFIYPKAYSE